MAWHKIPVNVQNIKYETDKAYLIAMPHSSDYDGFKFWISKKLVRAGWHSFEVMVSVSDDMTIKLTRTSPKTRAVLAEETIGVKELAEAFGESRHTPIPEETVTITPAPLTPEKKEAHASLIR